MVRDDVDAIVTWVDGSDPDHIERRREALRLYGNMPGAIPAGSIPTRFADNGELQLALFSLRANAPWLRNIYVVTDKQKPKWLSSAIEHEMGVKLIDHAEIFEGYEWALPTFNSRTIETAIWRIKGLSERFIYLNDDFLILKPAEKEDFFVEGKVVVRGDWKTLRLPGLLGKRIERVVNKVLQTTLNISRTMSLHAQMRGAILAGFRSRYFWAPHVPHAINKSTLANYFSRNPDVFVENIRYRFRNEGQFVSSFLARHLEISNGKAIFKNADDVMMIPGRFVKRSAEELLDRVKVKEPKFLCIQSLDEMGETDRELLLVEIGRMVR